MGKIRLIIAIIIGKLMICLTKLTGSQGTVFPGRIARIIYPDILKILGENISEEIIVITGTNGKTTTSNMVAQILKEHDYSLVHNAAGANMITGITTAFIDKTNLMGTKIFHYALLETDEANIPLLLKELTPKVVVITNFFSDQLDRFGQLDNIINLVKDALINTKIELVLNADDPLVTHFQSDTGLHCWYFGFKGTDYDKKDSSYNNKEGKHCVFCQSELVFDKYHYAQLGKFYCPNCGNKNPEPNFVAHSLVMNPTISFWVNDIYIESPYQGFYNAYNILAAVSIAKLVGLKDEFITNAIKIYQPQAGRMESFNIAAKKVILILVKNPIGLNQAMAALEQEIQSKNILFILNDNAGDSRDVSWIWETDLEMLATNQLNINNFICAGTCSGDIAVRLKYSGFPAGNIVLVKNLAEGIEELITRDSEVCYLFTTYSALFSSRKMLIKYQDKYKADISALKVKDFMGMGE